MKECKQGKQKQVDMVLWTAIATCDLHLSLCLESRSSERIGLGSHVDDFHREDLP